MGPPGPRHRVASLTGASPVDLAGGSPLVRPRPARRRRSGPPIWTDRWSVLLFLIAVTLDGALALALWREFDSFPELVALHFSVYGDVDIIGPKSDIFRLPLIGAVVWGTNSAIAVMLPLRDRVLARTALGIACGVLVLFCLAAWRIVA